MNSQSRRKFIKICSYLPLLAPLGAGIFSLFYRKQEYDSKSLADIFLTESPGDKEKEDKNFEPAYISLHKSGELKKRGQELWEMMRSCKLCPRLCGVNRIDGEKGTCKATSQLEIYSYHPHFGEERPLVGRYGSGTIFFTHCSLRCVFCINWEISQEGWGKERSLEELSDMMLALQKKGCHNINFVTPTHYLPHIILAVDIAASKGLKLPLVYNTCGWERVEILKTLDCIIDIYLPDFKYYDSKMSAKYSSDADTYPEMTKVAILEMHRQVGVAKPADDGLMYRGLMIRHLVMPNNVGGTKDIIKWASQNLPLNTYLNIMSQYRPMYKAFDYPEIARRITYKEYYEVVKYAQELGFTNLDIQGF